MRSSSGGGWVSSLLAEEDGCWGLGADGISCAGSAIDMLRPRVQHACCCSRRNIILVMCVTFRYVLIGVSMMDYFKLRTAKNHFFRPEKYKLAPLTVLLEVCSLKYWGRHKFLYNITSQIPPTWYNFNSYIIKRWHHYYNSHVFRGMVPIQL